MNVKITCFPTLTQRRELCALSHNAAQFREELFDAMIHHPQRIEDAPLPEAYQSLPTAMLQQVWKQAQGINIGFAVRCHPANGNVRKWKFGKISWFWIRLPSLFTTSRQSPNDI